ncbi:hypothetical protein CCP1ISM_140017 [Azospirillaceae bacterium]
MAELLGFSSYLGFLFRCYPDPYTSTLDEADELPITAINAAGGGFDWLADEPDLYSDADLVERYRP